MREIVELVARRARSSRWSGETIDFDDIPAAIEAMESRQTVGRTIVIV